MQLRDQNALVVGGSKGVGLAVGCLSFYRLIEAVRTARGFHSDLDS